MLDTKSKYRLIGAGLLIASSAILLPLVLDGERPEQLNVQISVPEKPDFPDVAIAPVQPLADIAEAPAQEAPIDANEIELIPVPQQAKPTSEPIQTAKQEAPKPQPVTTKKEPEKTPVKKELAPIGDRWTLQVATFGKKDNAQRTLKKLQDAGYPAYVMTTNSLYKVFVGPELQRDVSEKVKAEIKKKFKLSGIVVKYSPNS